MVFSTHTGGRILKTQIEFGTLIPTKGGNSGETFPQSDLNYAETNNGVLVTHNGLMVAWIYQGYAGSKANARACQCYDVAFPSLS